MTCKVVIDAFETEEEAVAFISWLKTNYDIISLFTLDGMKHIEYDGVDTDNSTKEVKVVNIVTFDAD